MADIIAVVLTKNALSGCNNKFDYYTFMMDYTMDIMVSIMMNIS